MVSLMWSSSIMYHNVKLGPRRDYSELKIRIGKSSLAPGGFLISLSPILAFKVTGGGALTALSNPSIIII
jgi:hypothetical protein